MRTLRLLLFLALIVIVQVTVFPHLRWLGVVPDLGLLVAVAVGYREGPEAGALVGFIAGLCYDLFLETPLGFSALAYALVGYGVGTLQAGMLRSPRWLPPFLGAAGGFVGVLFFDEGSRLALAAVALLSGWEVATAALALRGAPPSEEAR